ncbi:hypothetical protein CPLU01_12350 [Colletotrichum plurivorum]|uniref:Uncharacterized protein n=1 Tax=Colletotrichum plurivorum TaxID=2175906 RepID=A0A8H6JZD4_9PEZI|nr:hypothetical protein CPLU01_12350 [Colletotrichum plurivorum]
MRVLLPPTLLVYLIWRKLWKRSPRTVVPRVAVFSSRWAAAQSALAHVPAIAAIVTIAFFVYRDTWIGSELTGFTDADDQKLLGLQITAKLLELMVVFSLGCILFAALRHEIVQGYGIPVASLISALNFARPSLLWSQEMAALLTAGFSKPWKKIAFILCLVVFAILALIVAPATASALTPEKNWYPAGGGIAWLNVSASTLFPDHLSNESAIAGDGDGDGDHCMLEGDNRCPSAHWRDIRDRLIEGRLTEAAVYSPEDNKTEDYWWKNLRLPHYSGTIWGGKSGLTCRLLPRSLVPTPWPLAGLSMSRTVATMPNHAIVDAALRVEEHWTKALRAAFHHGDSKREKLTRNENIRAFIFGAKHATVHVRCEPSIDAKVSDANGTATITFPDISDEFLRPTPLSEPVFGPWVETVLPSLSRPEILWFDRRSNRSHASLGAAIAMPVSGTQESNDTASLYGCSFDAMWRWATRIDLDTDDRTGYGTWAGLSSSRNTTRGTWLQEKEYMVHVRPSFARLLNPRLRAGEGVRNATTVFEELMSGTTFRAGDRWKPGYIPHLESVLAAMLVNGMARTAPWATMFSEFRDDPTGGHWWSEFLPKGGATFGRPSRTAYAVPGDRENGNLDAYYRVRVDADVFGYAYTSRLSGMSTSMIILLAYLPIVGAFLVWSLATGITSTSWDSVSELLLLALKSPPPGRAATAGTSAGITELAPLRERYWVAKDAGGGNELAFKLASGGDCPADQRVEVNKSYH